MAKCIKLEPLEKHPNLQFDAQDIEIIAEHYGYNYASIKVKGCGFNGNLIGHFGYCLIDNNGNIVDDLNWENDVELLKKFYDFDKSQGFIEKNMTFEEFKKKLDKKSKKEPL